MASCRRCKKPISRVDAKKQVAERDDEGRLVGVYHLKCHFVMRKQERIGGTGRYLENSPTAYEQAARSRNADDLPDDAYTALAVRQEEIAAESAKDPRPEMFTDWRDPTEIQF